MGVRDQNLLYTDFMYKTTNQRFFFLSFNVDKCLLKVFYTSRIESVLTFAMICWFNLGVKKNTFLGKTVNVCRKVTDVNRREFNLTTVPLALTCALVLTCVCKYIHKI